MDLAQDLADVVELVKGAGVRAAADRRDLRVPGVLVLLRRIRDDRLGGAYTVDWDLVIVAGNSGQGAALRALSGITNRLYAAGLTLGDIEAATYVDPNHSGDPLPALTATLTTECED